MAMTNAERQKRYRQRHSPVIRKRTERQRQRHQELKKIVLGHYSRGGKDSPRPWTIEDGKCIPTQAECACVKCGESRLACLSIDHINGGGSRQRRFALRSTSSFYAWLENNNYPEGYQTLCMNCQFVKRFERHEEYKGK